VIFQGFDRAGSVVLIKQVYICVRSSFNLVNVCTNLFHLTYFSDINPVAAIIDPAVDYSLSHLEEEHIDQFMSSLQVNFLCTKWLVSLAYIQFRIDKIHIHGFSLQANLMSYILFT
jgi:hypothetical protein